MQRLRRDRSVSPGERLRTVGRRAVEKPDHVGELVSRRFVDIVQHGACYAEIGLRGVDLLRRDFQAPGTIGDARVILLGDQLDIEREGRLIVPIGDLQPAWRVVLDQLVILAEHAIVEYGPPGANLAAQHLQAHKFFVLGNQGRAQEIFHLARLAIRCQVHLSDRLSDWLIYKISRSDKCT